MFDSATLLAYLAASIAIILAPGPAQALVLARTLSDGKRAGILTGIGLNVGTLIHALAAALGLSAILATSALAFAVVKYIGAAYLIYLGIQALHTRVTPDATEPAVSATSQQVFTRAVITGLLNPKVALFFLAFLPQFVDPTRGSAFAQFLILGSLLAALDVLYEAFLAVLFGTISHRVAGSVRFAAWRQRITGVVLIGLGVRLALIQPE